MGSDIAITFEVLFELLRKEKNREELQDLKPSLYSDIETYIIEKRSVQERFLSAGNISEAQRVSIQLKNTERVFQELSDRRSKKILLLALYHSRAKSMNLPSNLLAPEKELFDTVLAALDKLKIGIKSVRTITAKVPDKNDAVEGADSEKDTPEKVTNDNDNDLLHESSQPSSGTFSELSSELSSEATHDDILQGHKEENADTLSDIFHDSEETRDQGNKEELAEKEEYVNIKIIKDVSEFTGPNLDSLGPYKEGDAISVEPLVADLLVNKGSAKRI